MPGQIFSNNSYFYSQRMRGTAYGLNRIRLGLKMRKFASLKNIRNAHVWYWAWPSYSPCLLICIRNRDVKFDQFCWIRIPECLTICTSGLAVYRRNEKYKSHSQYGTENNPRKGRCYNLFLFQIDKSTLSASVQSGSLRKGWRKMVVRHEYAE